LQQSSAVSIFEIFGVLSSSEQNSMDHQRDTMLLRSLEKFFKRYEGLMAPTGKLSRLGRVVVTLSQLATRFEKFCMSREPWELDSPFPVMTHPPALSQMSDSPAFPAAGSWSLTQTGWNAIANDNTYSDYSWEGFPSDIRSFSDSGDFHEGYPPEDAAKEISKPVFTQVTRNDRTRQYGDFPLHNKLPFGVIDKESQDLHKLPSPTYDTWCDRPIGNTDRTSASAGEDTCSDDLAFLNAFSVLARGGKH
jgi:hypothetical protein